MNATEDSQAWGAIRAGMRPSTMLAMGAVLTSLGPLLNLGSSLLLAWAVWGAALAICSAGMIMCGLRQWFSHLGVAAGLLYLAQFSALAAVVAGLEEAMMRHLWPAPGVVGHGEAQAAALRDSQLAHRVDKSQRDKAARDDVALRRHGYLPVLGHVEVLPVVRLWDCSVRYSPRAVADLRAGQERCVPASSAQLL